MSGARLTRKQPTRSYARRRPTHSAGYVGGAQSRRWFSGVLGLIGESMMTLGVLLGLFVVWELWYTDIVGNRAQAEIVANLDWEDSALPIPVDIAGDSQGPAVYPVIPSEITKRTDPPPVIAEPGEATTFATLYVPRWGFDYVKPVSQGVSKRRVLNPLGIGHYPDTAMPGDQGNFSLAAHRNTYGKPFSDIDQLVEGDAIIVRTENVWYVYRVYRTKIVKPTYIEAIAPVPGYPLSEPNGRFITLTTCHPRYSAGERYIVHGELEYWAPAGSGYPTELIPEDQRAPSTEGTI